jgi:hypothetical protein
LVFQLKRAIDTAAFTATETDFVRRAIASWRTNPAIEVLGDLDADRLPIVSFAVHAADGRRLHHNFVVALLSDLFGIQSRGGCSCAGPYGHRLLGIGESRAREFADVAVQGWLGIKPGWTRVSFSFYMSEPVFAYIVEAVHLVASYGARLLPEYRFDPRSGLWTHRRGTTAPASLSWLWYDSDGELRGYDTGRERVPEDALAGYLDEARTILAAEPGTAEPSESTDLPTPCERLRWFVTR